MSLYFFLILAIISIALALMVVFTKNPIYSVLFLVATMFTLAGQYILLNAQFLAFVHIIVYSGAVMVLFLFVLMMLNLNTDTEPQKSSVFKLIVTISAGMLFLTLIAAFKGVETIPVGNTTANIGLVKKLGSVLFKEYVVPFEISSVLFLASMVGAVMLTKNRKSINEEPLHL